MWILLILKIIGIVLLAILGIIVIAVLWFLFCPVKYRLYGQHEKTWYAAFKVSSFFRSIKVFGEYNEQQFYVTAKIFWGLLTIYPKKDKKNLFKKKDKKHFLKKEVNSSNTQQNENCKSEQKDDENLKKERANSKDIKRNKKDTKKKKMHFGKKSSSKKHKIKDFKDTILKEENKRAFSYVIKKIIWLLKKIKPKIKMADISFATGEPDLTGELTGVISLLPFAYGKKISILPDFVSEKPFVLGEIRLSGHVFGIHLVLVVLQILFQKDCKQLIKSLK